MFPLTGRSYKYTRHNRRCQAGSSAPHAVHNHWLWKTGFRVLFVSGGLKYLRAFLHLCVHTEGQWHSSQSRAYLWGGVWFVHWKAGPAVILLFFWGFLNGRFPPQECPDECAWAEIMVSFIPQIYEKWHVFKCMSVTECNVGGRADCWKLHKNSDVWMDL